jgi:RNA polymerase sigma-70 factor (ECF subfamily)
MKGPVKGPGVTPGLPRGAIVEQDEKALIARAYAGSVAAFEELMKRYEHLVYRVCFSHTGNRDDALDVTQEVFVKVFEKIETFRGSGSFKGWLLRITHNESLNWIRSRTRHGEHMELTAANPQGLEGRQETDLFQKERHNAIAGALLHLSPRQRTALTLRYFERMSINEISSLLGCTQGTTKNILFRSLRKLRDQLTLDWEES